MTTTVADGAGNLARPKPDLAAAPRFIIGLGGTILSLMALAAMTRAAFGLAPDHAHLRELAIIIHLAAVLPAIPLGAYLLVARKGTARHRLLGKIWLMLMLVTACSAIFIRTGGGFSLLHLFIPLTFLIAWRSISTARRHDIAGHRKSVVIAYVSTLLVPGAIAFLMPGRLMYALLFG